MGTTQNAENIKELDQISKKRKVFFYIIMLFVAMLLTFLSSEGILRIFFKDAKVFSDDKLIRHKGKPHAKVGDFKLNSKGFMDVEIQKEKARGTYRILAIGDSFVYGAVGYEKNFLTLLENYLNDAGKNFEILNMGIPGTEPPEYHRLLQQDGMSYNPDMVVVFFYVGNDIVLFLNKNMTPEKPVFYTLRLVEQAYKAITKLNLWKIYSGKLDGGIVKDEKQYIFRKIYNLGKYMLDGSKQSLLMFDPKFSQRYWESLAPLLNINNLCKDKGIEFVVVLIPEDIQVDPKLAEAVLKNYKSIVLQDPNKTYSYDLAKKGESFDFSIPNKALGTDLKRYGIQVIDLYDSFAGYYKTDTNNLYIPFDGHWNERGNDFAARSLLGPLLKNADIVSFMGRVSNTPAPADFN